MVVCSLVSVDGYDGDEKEDEEKIISRLTEVLCKELYFLWSGYVLEEDDNLSPKAIELKNNLRSVLEEI